MRSRGVPDTTHRPPLFYFVEIPRLRPPCRLSTGGSSLTNDGRWLKQDPVSASLWFEQWHHHIGVRDIESKLAQLERTNSADRVRSLFCLSQSPRLIDQARPETTHIFHMPRPD